MTVPTPPPPPVNIADLVRGLLDGGYNNATGAVIRSITGSVNSGLIQQRTQELQAEAQRLREAGERMSADNAVLRALTADLETVMRQNTLALQGIAERVQLSGIDAAAGMTQQLSLAGFGPEEIARLGIQWNQPDPQAVARLVNFIESPAWADELAQYGPRVLTTINNIATRGFALGWSPQRVANEIIGTVSALPQADANNLMRTLQLQSMRQATAVHQIANADIIDYQIRMAVLDTRTCLSCIAQHGDILPIGALIEDHYRGRCFSITHVRGLPDRNIESGVDWFNRQSAEMRLEIAGEANFNALQAGAVELRQFVHRYEDPIFGFMVRESSLKGILGDAAEQYYSRNQN